MNITFRGREIEVEEVCEGLVKKNDKTFYCKCRVTGDWFYCIKSRLARLVEKLGSEEEVGKQYLSRKGKKQLPAVQAPAEPSG